MTSSFQTASYNFSFSLANEVLKLTPEVDACFSPASLTLVLAMCFWGSGNKTREQLKQKVFKGLDDDQISKQTVQMIKDVDKSGQFFTLAYANRMYASKNYVLKQQYAEKLRQDYRADIFIADFAKNAAGITNEVNQWVETTTRQKIKNLLQPRSLTPDTALLLINALYFKGFWVNKFRESQTKKQDFFTSSSKTAKVDMMSQKGDFNNYAETPEVQVLELRYDKSTASMLIMLPKSKFGLSSFLTSLTDVKFLSLLQLLRSEKVDIKLPKFKIEKGYELGKSLIQMGLKDLLNPIKADLTGMVQHATPRLYASGVAQKSFIDVNENGTEAAAVTILKRVGISLQLPTTTKSFVADHPFLFAILNGHENDRHVLFLGQYYNN